MNRLFVTLVGGIFFSIYSLAQPTFPCDSASRLYFFQDTLTNGSLSYISGYTSGAPKITFLFEMPTSHHNGLGANPKDGYLYYLSDLHAPIDSLMRLDASGNAKGVCKLPFVTNCYYGCFDPWGRYWTVNSGNNTLVAIDINTGNILKGPYAISTGGWDDIVFNPYDCFFYYGTSRIDTSGIVDPTYTGVNFKPNGNYGAVAIGSDGNIYGVAGGNAAPANAAGNLSKIDLTSNTSSNVFGFNTGPDAGQSDMASFICFSLTAAFKITPGSLCYAPFNVTFTDQTIGKINSWTWDFGDPSSGIQNTSALKNPAHTYQQPGIYIIKLVVSGGGAKICYVIKDSVNSSVSLASIGPTVSNTPTNLKCYADSSGTISVKANGTGTITYNWSSGVTINATPIASHLAAGSYSVTVSDATGCQIITNATLTQPSALSLTGTGLNTSCNGSCDGQAVVIPSGGTGTINALWSTGGTSLSISKLCASSYSVTITDANNCQKDTVLSVVEPTLIKLVPSSTPAGCNQSDGSVGISASGGTTTVTGGYTYLWNTGSTAATISNIPAGSYTITVTDNNNCTKVADTTVANLSGVNAGILSKTDPGCFGGCNGNAVAQAIPGTGTAPFQYLWSNGTNLVTTGNLCKGNYTVTITDTKGCTSSASVIIDEPPALVLSNLNAPGVCVGQQTALTVVPSGGTPAYTISWMPGGQTGTTINVQPPLVTNAYTITVTDSNACVSAPVIIDVNAVPVIKFKSDTLSGCPGLCVNFTDQSTVEGGNVTKWAWSFGNGSVDNVADPSSCYPDAGNHTVQLTVTSNEGCMATDSIHNMIIVFALPHAAFTTDPKTVSVIDPTFHYIDQSTGAVAWLWNFGDPAADKTSSVENPSHTFENAIAGSYCTLLTVKNAEGCIDTTTLCMEIGPDFDFFVPDAFTPNGDRTNDTFNGKGIGIKKYQMVIFDRWGNLIFTTYDLNVGWDGTANGGDQIAQQDVYVYRIVLTDVFNKEHDYIGRVALFK